MHSVVSGLDSLKQVYEMEVKANALTIATFTMGICFPIALFDSAKKSDNPISRKSAQVRET